MAISPTAYNATAPSSSQRRSLHLSRLRGARADALAMIRAARTVASATFQRTKGATPSMIGASLEKIKGGGRADYPVGGRRAGGASVAGRAARRSLRYRPNAKPPSERGDRMDIPFRDDDSQMSLLERGVITGLLAELRPEVAIELGTWTGSSLRQIAAWSQHVHTFDLALKVDRSEYPGVDFHIGDSHKLLPGLLASLETESQFAQFVLVDGDHSPGGVRQDLLDLLNSSAIMDCVIALHDTANESVRRGIESVPFRDYDSTIAWMDLDFAPSQQRAHRLAEAWGGLGLILISHDERGRSGLRMRQAERPDDAFRHARRVVASARRVASRGRRGLGPRPGQPTGSRRVTP